MIGRRVVIAAVLLAVVVSTSVSAAGAAKPKQWVTVTNFWPESSGPSVVGSASGRAWIGFASDRSRTRLGSIRRIGGRLSFVRTDVVGQIPMMIVGSQLVFHTADNSGKPGPLRTAQLLANGRVGEPKAVADDPENIPPQQLDPVAVNAITASGRTVWILTGGKMGEGGGVLRSYLWACCTSRGELSELTRYMRQGATNLFMQLGVDGKQHVWLSWLESTGGGVVGPVKLLELDPQTLVPRTPKAVTVPGGATAIDFRLVCAVECRVVLGDLRSGDLRTTSPGHRAATTLALGTRETPVDLLDATVRAGQLTTGSITLRRPRDLTKAAPQVVEVFRAAPSGSHSRLVGSVALPPTINPLDYDHYALYQFSRGAFVPGGLAYFAMYYPGHDTKTRLLAGVVPVR